MQRPLTLAAAQLGPIARDATRAQVVARMVNLLTRAAQRGCRLLVFPEMALTTFFPRWQIDDQQELAGFFETSMPNASIEPLFSAAAALGIGFYLGYCEEDHSGGEVHRYNTSILVDETGSIVSKYRKIHLPGNAVYDPTLKLQHLEPWYFEPGNLGFPVVEAMGARIGMLLCNDRRWAEPWRVLALQGAELVLLGYNSPAQLPDNPAQNPWRVQHHQLPMRAAAYQNGLWIVATAKAGHEEGCDMMGGSCVIAPSGEVVGVTSTLQDELLVVEADLDMTREYKQFFDFDRHRRPECYRLICERRGAGAPLTPAQWEAACEPAENADNNA